MVISSFPVKTFSFLILLLCCCTISSFAQDPVKTPTPAVGKPKDETLKINTSLIQTGIAVFDKKQQFVGNLKQEDFELRVDGKLMPISFFEQVMPKNTLKTNIDKPKTEVGGVKTSDVSSPPVRIRNEGRTVLFVVDDLHLSLDSLKRTKDLILKFIDSQMQVGDTVAIVSTNGKLGFLQQFTNDKTVLQTAVAKLIYTRDNSGAARFSPRMTEYEALLVDRRDQDMTDIFANILLKSNPDANLESLREQARTQARSILLQAAVVSRNTYSTLEQAVRGSAQQPGRKIVFMLSDGFLLDIENTDASNQLHLIIDAAIRANAVIYSFDAKGLEADMPEITPEVSTGIAMSGTPTPLSSGGGLPNKNFTANSYRVQAGDRFESQDGLNLLAEATGGRFIHNTNDLQTGMIKALDEAAVYYLLAWQPDSENPKSEKLRRIEVSIKGHPELQVRMQNGYLDGNPKTGNNINPTTAGDNSKTTIELPKTVKPVLSAADEQLNNAINEQTPRQDLPTMLSVNYMDMPNDGAILAAVLQIKSAAIEFTPKDDEATANIDLLGIIYDSNGKREGSFRKILTVNVAASQLEDHEDIYYNYQTKLKPGLYQLRVAARDVKSGHTGSNSQWLEIPDLSSRKLALSSLLFSNLVEDAKPRQALSDSASALAGTEVSVDRRFDGSSSLRYLIFVYNADRGPGGQMAPDITLQTQILLGDQVVITAPAKQISVEGQDSARLPYAADIPLDTLAPGIYELKVTVQDRTAKTTASQHLSFEIK